MEERGLETELGKLEVKEKLQSGPEDSQQYAVSERELTLEAKEADEVEGEDEAGPEAAARRKSWLSAFSAVSRRRGGGIEPARLGDALRLAGFVLTEAEVAQYREEAAAATGSEVTAIGTDVFLALAAKARREFGWSGDADAAADDFERLRAALAVFADRRPAGQGQPAAGRVPAADLARCLTSLGEPIEEADVAHMLEHLVDEQGLLDYTELAHRLVSLT